MGGGRKAPPGLESSACGRASWGPAMPGRSSRMADFWAQQTTLADGQRKRSVISALLKQEKDRMGAMQVPGQ